MKQYIHDVVQELKKISTEDALKMAHDCPPPDRLTVVRIVKALQAALFPLCFRRELPGQSDSVLLLSLIHI